MEKKIGVLVVLLVGVVMVAYSFFTIKEEKELASQLVESEILMALGEVDENISNYLETYVDLIYDLSLNKDILYSEQMDYKGFVHMESLATTHPEILNIYYGSKTGEMLLWPEMNLPDGYDPRERPWYTGAQEGESIVWSPPYRDFMTGHLILTGAIQVIDNQLFNGVLGFDLVLEEDVFLENVDLSIDYEVVVLSKWGSIIYHTDNDLIGQNNLDAELSQGIEDGLTFFEYVPYRTMLDIDQNNIEASSTRSSESKDERTAYVKSNDFGWSIILTVGSDDL